MLKTKTAKGMIFIPLDIGYGSLTKRNATGKSNVPLPPQLKLIQADRALDVVGRRLYIVITPPIL